MWFVLLLPGLQPHRVSFNKTVYVKICAYCEFTCSGGPLFVIEMNGKKKTINLNINLYTEAGGKYKSNLIK